MRKACTVTEPKSFLSVSQTLASESPRGRIYSGDSGRDVSAASIEVFVDGSVPVHVISAISDRQTKRLSPPSAGEEDDLDEDDDDDEEDWDEDDADDDEEDEEDWDEEDDEDEEDWDEEDDEED